MDRVDTRRAVAIGAALVLGAIVVRLWGIGWGLPYAYHADEPVNLTTTLTMVKEHDPNPRSFIYPGLFYYTHAAGQLAYFGVGKATGTFESPSDISLPEPQTLANARLGNPNSLLAGRLVSVAFSAATVAIVYAAVLAVGGGLGGAALAGFVMAFAPLAVRRGRLLTPDPIALFFTAAALAASFLVLRRGRPVDYAIAGALVGLAGASKYHVALVAIAVLTAHIMRTGRQFLRQGTIYLAAAVAVATFLVASPFVVVEFDAFWTELTTKTAHYQEGHGGAEGGSLLFYGSTLFAEYGALLLFVPFAFADRRFRREATIAAAFAAAYFLFIAFFVVRFDRHLLPALPAVAMTIGFGSAGLLAIVRTRFGHRGAGARIATTVIALIILVGIAIPLVETVADGRRYSSDERGEARDWITATLSAGSKVLVDAYAPFVDPDRFVVTDLAVVVSGGGTADAYDYAVIAEQGTGRFLTDPSRYPDQVAQHEERFRSFCEIARFEGEVWTRVLARDC